MSNLGKTIDWSEIRRAIKNAEESTEAAIHPGQEQIERILHVRAAQLAVAEAAPVTEQQCDLTLFTIEAGNFAIETRFVHGIAKAGKITRLYGTPEHLLGIGNYQGNVIAIVDSGMAYLRRPVVQEDAQYLLILGDVQVELAFLVNSVDSQIHLPISRISPSISGGQEHDLPDVIKGIVTGLADYDVVSLFDGDALLRDPRLYFEI